MRKSVEVESRGAIGIAVKRNPLRLALQLGNRLGEILVTRDQARDLGAVLICLAGAEEAQVSAGAVVHDVGADQALLKLSGASLN
jgi:hypothetical protein